MFGVWVLFQFVFAALATLQPTAGRPPDLLVLATPAALLDCISTLGAAGRAAYVYLFCIDTVYPVVYSGLLAGGIVLGARARNRDPLGARLAMLPLAAAAFDWCENVSFLTLMSQWPRPSRALAWAACVFNSAKWGLVAVSAILAVLGLVAAALSARPRRNPPGD